MKKFLLALLCVPVLGFAQGEYKTGARIGIGQSTFTNLDQAKGVIHFMGGFNSTYLLNENLGFSAELLVNTIGTEYRGVRESGGIFSTDQPYTGDLRFVSINIPVYPTIALGSEDFKFTIHGGPSINFNVFGRESRDFDDDSVDDVERESLQNYETFNFTVVYGAGVRIKTGAEQYVFLDFRMNNSLTDVYTTDENVDPTSTRANYFSISTGYMF
jgi:hypothetical protein